MVNIEPKYPASDGEADLAATRRADAYMNRQYLDPALLGAYPAEMPEIFGEAWPDWAPEDLELIRQKVDFIGVNYYTRSVVRNDPLAWPLRAAPVRQKQHTHTETGWEVFPQGLTDTLLWVARTLRQSATVYHRERRSFLRSAAGARRAAWRTL